MKIKELTLQNFRCFEDLKIKFNEDYTVLIGINGAGKSTILEGISIALGTYLNGFPDIKSASLTTDHIRLNSFQNGSVMAYEKQFPASVNIVVKDEDNNEYKWGKVKKNSSGKAGTITPDGIVNYAKNMNKQKKENIEDVILPVLAYFGTNRLYNYKDKSNSSSISNAYFLDGYKNCLSSTNNSNDMTDWIKRMTLVELQDGQTIPELQAVKKAITSIYPKLNENSTNCLVKYSIKSMELELQYTDNNKTTFIPVRLLSDGVRITLSVVANIAYRMALLNANLGDSILESTPGIVMIDEIDMHLHPAWQKRILPALKEIFPKVQFIVTTHSPSVIANVTSDHILLLDNGKVYSPSRNTYGKNIDSILKEIMNTNSQADDVVDLLKEFYAVIEKNDLSKAEDLLNQLKDIVGEDYSEYIEAKMTLDLERM